MTPKWAVNLKMFLLRVFCFGGRTTYFRALILVLGLAAAGCKTTPRPGTMAHRKGDEIVAAGQFIHTGTPVVLWMDPGGYDAYRVERRFSPIENSDWAASSQSGEGPRTPNRYNMRSGALTAAEREQV